MNDWLTGTPDEVLDNTEIEVRNKVSMYDGYDDAMYRVWKTLLELIWGEQKRRKQ